MIPKTIGDWLWIFFYGVVIMAILEGLRAILRNQISSLRAKWSAKERQRAAEKAKDANVFAEILCSDTLSREVFYADLQRYRGEVVVSLTARYLLYITFAIFAAILAQNPTLTTSASWVGFVKQPATMVALAFMGGVLGYWSGIEFLCRGCVEHWEQHELILYSLRRRSRMQVLEQQGFLEDSKRRKARAKA